MTRSTEGLEGPHPGARSRPGGRRSDQGIRVDPDAEAEHPTERTVIAAIVLHEPGVLATVSGLFSRRQFNILGLTVGPTADDDYARITLVVEEPRPGIDQVEKQLASQLEVVRVTELAGATAERELALIKVGGERPERVEAVTRMHDGTVVDADPDAITVEVTGPEGDIDAAIDSFERFGIQEIARTGPTALVRGPKTMTDPAIGPGESGSGAGSGEGSDDGGTSVASTDGGDSL